MPDKEGFCPECGALRVDLSVPASAIITAIGAHVPIVREYVHDYGLARINLSSLEDDLRGHLIHRATLRAEWPLRVKKLRQIHRQLDEVTLGPLATKLENAGGPAEIVAGVRALVPDRNHLRHNRIDLMDLASMKIPRWRIDEVRTELKRVANDAFMQTKAIQKANLDVFFEIRERIKREEPGTPAEMAAMAELLGDLWDVARDKTAAS